MVRPFRRAPPRRMARRGRQPGKTKILTMTPEKENGSSECLTETPNSKKSNLNNDTCAVMKNDVIRKQKINNIKKRVFEKSDTESVNENSTNKKLRRLKEKLQERK